MKFFLINPYFETYPWKDLLTRKLITVIKGFYDIFGENMVYQSLPVV